MSELSQRREELLKELYDIEKQLEFDKEEIEKKLLQLYDPKLKEMIVSKIKRMCLYNTSIRYYHYDMQQVVVIFIETNNNEFFKIIDFQDIARLLCGKVDSYDDDTINLPNIFDQYLEYMNNYNNLEENIYKIISSDSFNNSDLCFIIALSCLEY